MKKKILTCLSIKLVLARGNGLGMVSQPFHCQTWSDEELISPYQSQYISKVTGNENVGWREGGGVMRVFL